WLSLRSVYPTGPPWESKSDLLVQCRDRHEPPSPERREQASLPCKPPLYLDSSTDRRRAVPLHRRGGRPSTVADRVARSPLAEDTMLDTPKNRLDLTRANIGV